MKNGIKLWALAMTSLSLLLFNINHIKAATVNLTGSPTHIGTFEGSTTFVTSSSNDVNPGLYLEVMDRYGKVTEYESEDGVITVPDTKEGAYVTAAKLLGKTKYRDIDTNELLDTWQEGRNLKLESSKMPVLKTTGKNIFNKETVKYNTIIDSGGNETPNDYYVSSDFVPVKENTTYYTKGLTVVIGYDVNKQSLGYLRNYSFDGSFLTPNNCKYVRIRNFSALDDLDSQKTWIETVRFEEGSTATPYEPFKSNILTVNEGVELHGIGDVKDELNLVTGELTQRFNLMDNFDEIEIAKMSNYGTVSRYDLKISDVKPHGEVKSNLFPKGIISTENLECINVHGSSPLIQIQISTTKLAEDTIAGFMAFLKNSNLEIIYEIATESIKTVDLNSTYTFGKVSMRDVYVDGDVKSLICSVNVPTDSLSFVLDPNQEEGNQFIAPTFSLINETPASIRVMLKSFEQETDVFNDVLPTKHSDWSQLDKEQSKDIALSLVPIASDGWVEVDVTPRYVANHSSTVLGEIKAKSTVDLTFEALHGQAFTENLSPRYKLVFVFDF